MANRSIYSSFVLGSALMTGFLLMGCNQEATAPISRNASESDLAFATDLQNIYEFDSSVIATELSQTSDPRIEALAQQLLAQVDAFYAEVRPILDRDGIVPPEDMRLVQESDMHTRLAARISNSKEDFDRDYIHDELSAYRSILGHAENVLREPTGDPELHRLLIQGDAQLRSDIARLEQLGSELSQ